MARASGYNQASINGISYKCLIPFAIKPTRSRLLDREDSSPDVSWETQHLTDHVDAIRTGRPPSAGIDEAHHSVALVHLANLALKTGRSMTFDPKTETINCDDEASRLLAREYRRSGHWAIPF